MPKQTMFTPEEEKQIFSAASRTWGEIASDAAQLGATGVDDAIELVFDADRVVMSGGLDKKLYEKFVALPYKKTNAWLKKNKRSWF